jgi:arylsulfatase A-like enzyme
VILTCAGERQPLNVVIIAVDTLRPDHLGCYGYSRDTSPAIDALAERSALFENAVSQSPWTLPSFGSVFTSLYPSEHGAMSAVSKMRESFPTLATILSDNGYATGAIVNASVLKPEYGINRGFEFYDPTPLSGRIADGTTRDALAWVDDNRDRPFLLFAHYFDPHEPYAPPPPYSTRYRGNYAGGIGDDFVLHEHCPDVIGNAFDGLKRLSAADWGQIGALYDGEIAFTDSQIGLLLEGLQERDLIKNTLVIFLSDHGEEFNEHGGFGHGHSLYDEVIHVPLLFSLPGEIPEGKRVKEQVRLIDVMPTILDFLELETVGGTEGVSLAHMLDEAKEFDVSGSAILPPNAAYSEGLLHGPEQKSISRRPWKLVYDLSSRETSLFDRNEDPAEQHDVAAGRPDVMQPLNNLMVSALIRTSPTWFVEMAGQAAVFDLKILTDKGFGVGHIQLVQSLDRTGSTSGDIPGLSVEPHGLKFSGQASSGDPIVLAVQMDGPPRIPVEFRVAIDGDEMTENIFIGDQLINPQAIPFSLELRGDEARSKSSPRPRPALPYVLIWHTTPRFRGKTRMDLSESTRQELKALGYIQ